MGRGELDPDRGIASALAADLAQLVEGLDDRELALDEGIAALWRDFRSAVGSALGFTITVRGDLQPEITITQADRSIQPAEVGSSLRMPMDRPDALPPDYEITYYARRPGALVDLGADLVHALGLPLDAAVLDHPLGSRTITPGISGLSAFSTVNRAIGVLIEQGLAPDSARARLCAAGEPDLAEADAVIRASGWDGRTD